MTTAAIWARVSTTEQETANQVPVLEGMARARGFTVARQYVVEESAFTGSHRAVLSAALEDARRGAYEVLFVWALDRLSREGVEATLCLLRRLDERGVRVVSHEEAWLDGPSEMRELLSALFAWVARQESRRKSERVKAGLARRKAAGLPVGRQPGAKDKTRRKRSGYVARWESPDERARASERARTRLEAT